MVYAGAAAGKAPGGRRDFPLTVRGARGNGRRMHAARRLALLPLAVLAATACAPHRIPGTDIEDTKDTRAIFDVIQTYGRGMQTRDARTVLSVVSKQYYDDAGTPDPVDDMDYERLEKTLSADLAKLEAVRLELTIRKIGIDRDQAFADVLYDAWYRIQTPGVVVPKRESDVHRMRFKKEAGGWKIVAGL
jgi:hypothetical protein